MKSSAKFGYALVLSLTSASAAIASEQAGEASDCHDAIVKARIIEQVPSVVPDCGPDCIIMVWPWFLDLNVRKVVAGDAPRGRLETLIMLHTSFRRGLGTQRWWLRRNSLGGFNILRSGDEGVQKRCPLGSPPATSYLDPGPNKTLAVLRAEGERTYRVYRSED